MLRSPEKSKTKAQMPDSRAWYGAMECSSCWASTLCCDCLEPCQMANRDVVPTARMPMNKPRDENDTSVMVAVATPSSMISSEPTMGVENRAPWNTYCTSMQHGMTSSLSIWYVPTELYCSDRFIVATEPTALAATMTFSRVPMDLGTNARQPDAATCVAMAPARKCSVVSEYTNVNSYDFMMTLLMRIRKVEDRMDMTIQKSTFICTSAFALSFFAAAAWNVESDFSWFSMSLPLPMSLDSGGATTVGFSSSDARLVPRDCIMQQLSHSCSFSETEIRSSGFEPMCSVTRARELVWTWEH